MVKGHFCWPAILANWTKHFLPPGNKKGHRIFAEGGNYGNNKTFHFGSQSSKMYSPTTCHLYTLEAEWSWGGNCQLFIMAFQKCARRHKQISTFPNNAQTMWPAGISSLIRTFGFPLGNYSECNNDDLRRNVVLILCAKLCWPQIFWIRTRKCANSH